MVKSWQEWHMTYSILENIWQSRNEFAIKVGGFEKFQLILGGFDLFWGFPGFSCTWNTRSLPISEKLNSSKLSL